MFMNPDVDSIFLYGFGKGISRVCEEELQPGSKGVGPRASWSKVSIHEHLYNPLSSWFGVQGSRGPKSAPEQLLSDQEHLYIVPFSIQTSS